MGIVIAASQDWGLNEVMCLKHQPTDWYMVSMKPVIIPSLEELSLKDWLGFGGEVEGKKSDGKRGDGKGQVPWVCKSGESRGYMEEIVRSLRDKSLNFI